jgi:hypothetical protein
MAAGRGFLRSAWINVPPVVFDGMTSGAALLATPCSDHLLASPSFYGAM